MLTVFLYHYGGGAHLANPLLRSLGIVIHAGWTGVTLFFILSGFLISGILWDDKAQPSWWQRFYVRRTLRIFPLYYATLVLVLLAAIAVGHARPAISSLWVYALYLQNIPYFFRWAANTGSPLRLTHFWSLAVEEQFYLIWPFLLLRAQTLTRARNICLALFLFSIAFRVSAWAFLPDPLSYVSSLPARAGELAAGAWLAMASRDPVLWRRLKSLAPSTMIASALLFLATAACERNFSLDTPAMFLFGLPAVTVFFASLLVDAMGQGIVARLVSAAWLRWLGGISYGIYVFHVLFTPFFLAIVSTVAPHAGRTLRLTLTCIVAGVVTLFLAQLSFRFFERPFLSLRDRFRAPSHPSRRRHPLAVTDPIAIQHEIN